MTSLKTFIKINESQEKISKIIKEITKEYSRDKVMGMFYRKLKSRAPDDWSDQGYNSEMDWYSSEGRGDIENQIATDIIQEKARKNNINLSQSEFADLQNWFYNVYDFD